VLTEDEFQLHQKEEGSDEDPSLGKGMEFEQGE